MKFPYKNLERQLGYRFRHRHLLDMALTHRSFRFETDGVNSDNQRLEFLGDAVLGFATAAYVYQHFPEKDEGALTALRSQTTSGKALSIIGRDVGLGQYLKIGKGEEHSGGRKRQSNLADAMEAVIGAVYLDGGIKAVDRVYRKLFVPLLARLTGDIWENNPKGRLQEYSQRKWKNSPRYRVAARNGPPHAVVFTVEVRLNNSVCGTGTGPNKQEAEVNAAIDALKGIDSGEPDDDA